MNSSRKLCILFCPASIYGGINPCIGIGQLLHKRGHRIVMFCYQNWIGELKEYGFEEIVINEDNWDYDNDNEENLKYFSAVGTYDANKSLFEKMQLFHSKTLTYYMALAKQFSPNFKQIIDSVKPNLIIVDSAFIAIPSIIKSGIPWISIITSNPLRYIDDERTPPPFLGLSSNNSNEWEFYRNKFYNIINPVKEEINKWLIEEELSPLKERRAYYESPFLNMYNFPKELDYTDMRPLPSKYARFDGFVRNENTSFDIPQYLKEQSAPYDDNITLPNNMYGEIMIPQTKLIPLVDLVIFHGGHNTVVETFWFGKPMIVMPLIADAYDNAERIVEKGFGIKVNPLTCDSEELINAINTILNDNELINRLKNVSKRIQNEADSVKLVKAIEEIM